MIWYSELLLLPVVPDVLHIVVIFLDVDELLHLLDLLLGLQLLIVLRNHLDLGGNEGKIRTFLRDFQPLLWRAMKRAPSGIT